MINQFLKGGLIMWPILGLSILTLSIIIERLLFLIQETKRQDKESIQILFDLCREKKFDLAIKKATTSTDPLAYILLQGLTHRKDAFQEALIEASCQVLDRYNRGLILLDTAVTLGPLLGLLGTVSGMMKAFGIVGGSGLADKQIALTGGIAEALIAVTFGLCVAIIAIVPLNLLGAKLESQRRRIESEVNRLTLILSQKEN